MARRFRDVKVWKKCEKLGSVHIQQLNDQPSGPELEHRQLSLQKKHFSDTWNFKIDSKTVLTGNHFAETGEIAETLRTLRKIRGELRIPISPVLTGSITNPISGERTTSNHDFPRVVAGIRCYDISHPLVRIPRHPRHQKLQHSHSRTFQLTNLSFTFTGFSNFTSTCLAITIQETKANLFAFPQSPVGHRECSNTFFLI